MTKVTEWKSSLICFISFSCEKTQKVWFKNLWNWLCNWNLFNDIWRPLIHLSPPPPPPTPGACNWNLMIFDLFTPPFGPSLGPQGAETKKNVPFMGGTHTPNLVEFRKKLIVGAQTRLCPPSPTPGAWPRHVLYLSFVRRHTKFGFKIFEIDFVIEI